MPSFSALGGDCNFLAFHLDTFGLLLSTAQCAVVHYVIFNAVRWTYTSIPTPAKVIGNVRAPFLDPKIYWFGSSVWLCEWQELGVEPIFFSASIVLIDKCPINYASFVAWDDNRPSLLLFLVIRPQSTTTNIHIVSTRPMRVAHTVVCLSDIFFFGFNFFGGLFLEVSIFFFFFIERKSLKSVVEKDELNLYRKSPFKHSTSLLSLYWMVENPILAATTGKLSRVS